MGLLVSHKLFALLSKGNKARKKLKFLRNAENVLGHSGWISVHDTKIHESEMRKTVK